MGVHDVYLVHSSVFRLLEKYDRRPPGEILCFFFFSAMPLSVLLFFNLRR